MSDVKPKRSKILIVAILLCVIIGILFAIWNNIKPLRLSDLARGNYTDVEWSGDVDEVFSDRQPFTVMELQSMKLHMVHPLDYDTSYVAHAMLKKADGTNLKTILFSSDGYILFDNGVYEYE